jgi:hypothetical protein
MIYWGSRSDGGDEVGLVASAPALFHIFRLAVFTYFGINPFPLVKATKPFDLAVGKIEATAVALIFRFCLLTRL